MADIVAHVRAQVHQFSEGYVPAIYLNAEKLEAALIAEVGELAVIAECSETTRDTGAAASAWVAKLSHQAVRAAGTSVEVTVAHPETRALLIRGIAHRDGRVVNPCDGQAPPRHFVELEGLGIFVGPNCPIPDWLQSEVTPELSDVADELESIRAAQETEFRRKDPTGKALTLVLATSCTAACIVNDAWVRSDVKASYNGQCCVVFGLLERRHRGRLGEIVLVAPLAIWVSPTDVNLLAISAVRRADLGVSTVLGKMYWDMGSVPVRTNANQYRSGLGC